jgi:hypothetical protein
LSLNYPVCGYDHDGIGVILDTVFPADKVAQCDLAAVAARIRKSTAGGAPHRNTKERAG